MTSTQQERSQAWWMKQRRKLPWPAVYLIVLGITGGAQFAGYKLAGALSPDAWSYPMPKPRVFALKAEPFSTRLFAPVLPTNAPGNHLNSSSSITPTPGGGTSVPTNQPTPSQTPTPNPTASPTELDPIEVFEMTASRDEAAIGESFKYTINIFSNVPLGVVTVQAHLPDGLATEDDDCKMGGKHRCQWLVNVNAHEKTTIVFWVTVQNGVDEWRNHAHMRAGRHEIETDDCVVAFTSTN